MKDHADLQATVYTDDASAYETLPFEHESVRHSVSEYVRGQAHTNGVESFWSMLKRGYYGTFHKFSPKHLDRYVQEFAGRHNLREQDTIEMMGAAVPFFDDLFKTGPLIENGRIAMNDRPGWGVEINEDVAYGYRNTEYGFFE